MALIRTLAPSLKYVDADFEEDGTRYWRIRAMLNDGRVFDNVFITDRFELGFPGKTPFALHHVVEVMFDDSKRSDEPRELISSAPISAWADAAVLYSPDGRRRATIFDASEIAMGGPTSGVLSVHATDGGRCVVSIDGCNPSMVWSDDSRLLAIPFWRKRMQRLVIVDAEQGTYTVGLTEYRVMEMQRFDRGVVVTAVDSPIHAPATIAITIGATG